MSPTDSDSDYDSDHNNTGKSQPSNLSSSIFKAYIEFTNKSPAATSSSPVDLCKIQAFLNSSSSGCLSCLICLERIRPSDPTWSCSAFCFDVFHLVCIQSWARQSTDLAAARAATLLPISADKAAETATWNCPKCRSEYARSAIPRTYFCYCGRLDNPPCDNPWILPHSCGEVCGRKLRPECGHECLLLCHPGPCPPCPQLAETNCFCGKVRDVRRCGYKNFSCINQCSKLLDCGLHECNAICHDGACPPCAAQGVYACKCGRVNEVRECCNRDFRCVIKCERMLNCGKHVCAKGCHYKGECGECPLQGKRMCPCEKRVYEGLACDETAPLCGGTCDKMLSCGFHRCPERCHRGQCIETCRIVVPKTCRCRGVKKEVPCYQDLTCERKCLRMKDCGRHACRRRCCDGNCPPCSEICGRKLRCRNHKCPAPCHRGPCAPCPVMVSISCLCGETRLQVPCGTEMYQKPPRCRNLCEKTPLCRHGLNSKPHRCHYGACPPCQSLCEEEYPCGHKCKLRCHGPKPPPNPEFTLMPKRKKLNHQIESTTGSQCPPCQELVWRSCIGEHIGAERMMICSDKAVFACENLCGNPLSCGNHYCTKTCHALKSQSVSPSVQQKSGESCEECNLPCQKERMPGCTHPCLQPCHPVECPPCKALIKRSCHCGSMVHVFECTYFNTLSKEEQITIRSCGGPCHRKLPNCTHLCPATCHSGPCPSPEKCCKKITVRCVCQTLKKEWLCKDVQSAYRDAGSDPRNVSKSQFGIGLLPCNSECKSKVQVVDSVLQSRKPKTLEEKETQTEKNIPRRRRRREQVQEIKQVSTLQKFVATVKQLLLIIILVLALIAMAYYGYKGLLKLSDWMNELEVQRQKQRFRRI